MIIEPSYRGALNANMSLTSLSMQSHERTFNKLTFNASQSSLSTHMRNLRKDYNTYGTDRRKDSYDSTFYASRMAKAPDFDLPHEGPANLTSTVLGSSSSLASNDITRLLYLIWLPAIRTQRSPT